MLTSNKINQLLKNVKALLHISINPLLQNTAINDNNKTCDVLVIGGGIIGTAIAKTLKETLQLSKIILVEKEYELCQHQSGHNSGVIHAGIYYKPDSLKAKLCVEGVSLIYKYCDSKNIPYKKIGKLIIAKEKVEINDLYNLYYRGLENNVPRLEILDYDCFSQIQPNCKGLKALWSPNTGNVDWKIVTQSFEKDFKDNCGILLLNHEVKEVKESNSCTYPVLITFSKFNHVIMAKYVVISTGLQSEQFTVKTSNKSKTISFRVIYQLLNPKIAEIIKTNVYAVPEAQLPFLGVHFSPTLDGNVLLGPSAVPAFKLEGYRDDEINLTYLKNVIGFCGFQKMIIKNLSKCYDQASKNLCSDYLTQELNKFFPAITKNDVLAGPCAVQAQIIDCDGNFIDDFIIEVFEGDGIMRRVVYCRFIPSPGATSCLAIAQKVASEIRKVYCQ